MALLGIIGGLQKYFLELAEAISFDVIVGHTEPSFNYLGSWEPKGRV